jgi:hypothetical protein
MRDEDIDNWLRANGVIDEERAAMLCEAITSLRAWALYSAWQEGAKTIVRGPVSMLELADDSATASLIMRLAGMMREDED